MARITVKSLVTEDLGYCCTWFFFKHYRKTALIAARLGVTDRAVRLAKEKVDEGLDRCAECKGCLNKKINLKGALRKTSEENGNT